MSKLYKLTQQTHELVEKLAKQENIRLSLQYSNAWYIHHEQGIKHCVNKNGDFDHTMFADKEGWYVLLQANQIRQILRAFEEFLGKTLCQRWLDGLNPMIDSEPEKVLEELIEVLQSKIKK